MTAPINRGNVMACVSSLANGASRLTVCAGQSPRSWQWGDNSLRYPAHRSNAAAVLHTLGVGSPLTANISQNIYSAFAILCGSLKRLRDAEIVSSSTAQARAWMARRGWPYGTGTWPRRSPGCRTRCLARPVRPPLTGMPAIWSAVGGVSPAPSRAPQAGSGASAGSSGARSVASSPHSAGVMLMPDSRQPGDGAGNIRKYLYVKIVRLGMLSRLA